MKAVNAYYRKNKTLDGCPHLSAEQTEKLKAAMSGSYRANPKPFESYQLSNNNAEIRRLKDRITTLTRRKELGYVGWEFDGGRVEANTADNRLQIFFDEKPDKDIREELKGNGFRYAPSAEAWQRQLNDNAIYAADRIKRIQPLTGESPTELQKRARQEAAAQKGAEPGQPQDAPEYIYKMEANPRSGSADDRFFIQAYLPLGNGRAEIGDVLFIGTAEKCRELMGQLNTGELTQGQVKELYAQEQEAAPGMLPDPTISTADMKRYGYSWDGMLPLRETAATELFEKEDMQIFLLHGDGSESIADSAEDIKSHADRGGIMGVHKEDWEALREYREMKQELAEGAPAKEVHLLYGKEDAFGIYQLKGGAGMRDYHFEPYDRLQAAGLSVEATNYDLIYTAGLTPGTSLEDIYTRFNIDHPKDFRGHSLSVSDIVVLHQNGENTAHYVDSIGYREVPEFLQGQAQQLGADTRTDDRLKHVEDAIEQNDNHFDGIINNTPTAGELEAKARNGEQISLAEYAAALKAEKEQGGETKTGKKPSIRAQLKADRERAAQKKQARNKPQDLERS